MVRTQLSHLKKHKVKMGGGGRWNEVGVRAVRFIYFYSFQLTYHARTTFIDIYNHVWYLHLPLNRPRYVQVPNRHECTNVPLSSERTWTPFHQPLKMEGKMCTLSVYIGVKMGERRESVFKDSKNFMIS